MDETTRWMLVLGGLTLAAIGVHTHRATIPHFVATPLYVDARTASKPRHAYVRHLATALGIVGLLIVLAAILRWQAAQGSPPQPLSIGTDARSVGLGIGFLMLALIVLQLRARNGVSVDSQRALALKQDIDHWLRSAAPGLVDGGSRLPAVVYKNEAVEWTLLVVDDAGSWKKEHVAAELSCAAATLPESQARELKWNPIGASGALSAEPRWNVAINETGTHEATLALAPSVNSSNLRLMVEVKSIFNLTARQAAISGVAATAIGLALDAIGVIL